MIYLFLATEISLSESSKINFKPYFLNLINGQVRAMHLAYVLYLKVYRWSENIGIYSLIDSAYAEWKQYGFYIKRVNAH